MNKETPTHTCCYLGDGKQPCGKRATSHVSYDNGTTSVYFCEYHAGLILTHVLTELEKKEP